MHPAARAPGISAGRSRRPWFVLALTFAILSGCAARQVVLMTSGTPVAGARTDVVWLEQGWPQESLDIFAWGGLGAAFVPYSWFMVLEEPGGGLFRAADSMDRFGFLVDEPSPANPDGLPVGLGQSVDPETGEAHAGLTCAACHVGQIAYGKQAVRVVGGQALTNTTSMLGALLASVERVAGDEARIASMAAALTERDGVVVEPAALGLSLKAWLAERRPALEANAPPVPTGPGRVDALGGILNLTLGIESGIEGAARPVDAPVSYPALWDAHRMNANFAGAELGTQADMAVALNITQVLGSFPRLDVDEPSYATAGYPASVDIAALGDLQYRLRQLQPPAWPAMLPPIDAELAQRGRTLYEMFCVACHPILDAAEPGAPIEVVRVPLEEVGTDPTASKHFATRLTATGPYEGRPSGFDEGTPLGPEARAMDVLAHLVGGVMARRGSGASKAISLSTTPGVAAPPPLEPASYIARPLRGVWATAPYLHNGSVPTLYALLLPPEERPAGFYLGDGRFNPVDVGYAQDRGPGQSRLDTSLPGNGNGGHLYGTGLRNARRRELIEFLKTL